MKFYVGQRNSRKDVRNVFLLLKVPAGNCKHDAIITVVCN